MSPSDCAGNVGAIAGVTKCRRRAALAMWAL